MARLPTPGSDNGAWGQILNDFLSVEHNTDGTLKPSGSLAGKAEDNSVVHNTGNEPIAGTKTFSDSPIVPAPTSNGHAATKAYVDSAGSGEVNTASNVGVGGIGFFKQKTGVNLEFKNINAGSSKITVTNDAGNNEVDIDVTEANLNPANFSTNPLARANHTGTQAASTISDFTTAARTAVGPVVRSAYIKTGDVTVPNTSGNWLVLSGFEIQLPASSGEWVEIDINCLISPNGTARYDIGIIVGSSVVRYLSSGTSTPAVDGDPGLYPDNQPTTFLETHGPKGFVVTSGDLDGGNVRFVMVTKSAGAGTLFASTNYPFYWRALNLRTVS